MGKGDRKTAKGKRNISSYGKARPASNKKAVVTKAVATPKTPAAAAAPKKAPAKKAAK